jgi:multisubunit Na+/H+ antiporter MnhC subunit
MKKKAGSKQIRILVLYALFGMAVFFAVSILILWIYQEIAQPIPMALVIGALVGVAFKLFSDAIGREQKRLDEVERSSDRENAEKDQSDLAPPG